MTLLHLGNEYKICIRSTFDERMLWFEEEICVVATMRSDESHVRSLVDRWHEREAKRHLTERVRVLSEQTGWGINKLSFRRQSTIWGSCSSEKNLSLNLQLIHLAPELIDYVIVHELAHTIEMNHSRAFWRLVAQHVPNYPVMKRGLHAAQKQIQALC